MIGTAIGPYQVIAKLGEGGMGEVYRARDPRLARDVALKILRDRADGQLGRIDRFVAEARAVSALNHPNIVAVYDAAVEGATLYLVTELIEGESLASEMQRGPIALKRALDLATQIADGLAEAHAFGIVHGDLKPANIMITRGGRAKIVDFGLAHTTRPSVAGGIPDYSGDETETAPGLRGGTVPYMSPELARGEATDFRSDQFGFGLVLYEMVTGRPAFKRGTPAETLHAICNDEPPPLTAQQPPPPLMLSWIIERCLSKHPADRYGVTLDLHRDLRMLRDRLGDVVTRETPRDTAPMARRARAGWAVAVGAVVLLTGALAAIVWLLGTLQAPDVSALRFRPFATEAVYEGYPAWSPPGTVPTVAYLAAAEGIMQIFTRRLDSPAARQVTNEAVDARFPFWSPDGRLLYYITRIGRRDGLRAQDLSGGLPRKVLDDAIRAAISPDGKSLAFFRDDQGAATLWLANADGSQERRYDRAPFDKLRIADGALQFSPDGHYLTICLVTATVASAPEHRGWQLWLIPFPEGEPVRKLEQMTPIASPGSTSLSWFPDNRHIVFDIAATNPGAHLWMADLVDERVWPLTSTTGSEYAPAVSPDGLRIAFSSGQPQYDLYQIPIDNRSLGAARNDLDPEAAILNGHERSQTMLLRTARNETDGVWRPDGRGYAFVTNRSGHDEIWSRDLDPPFNEIELVNPIRDFTDGRTFLLSSPAYSPDGQRLAYQRNGGQATATWPVRIWQSLAPGRGRPLPLVVAPDREGYPGSPTFSPRRPDGEWMAFVELHAGEFRLVRVRLDGSNPQILRTDGVSDMSVRWSPAGDWITWETPEGFVLVSPDGGPESRLPDVQWLAHAWSGDGRELYGIRGTDDLRLVVEALAITTRRVRTVRDLGPSPPTATPVRGLSFNLAKQTLLTSLVKVPGDIWILEGFRPADRLIDRLWPRGQAP